MVRTKLFFWTYACLFAITFVFSGCTEGDDNKVEIRYVLLASRTEIAANGSETVNFTVKDNNGLDVTNEVILYKDGLQFAGTAFKSEIAKSHLFYAEKSGIKSNIIEVNVKPIIKHTKNILIEDYTGTWCGYCTRIAKATEDVTRTSDRIDVVAIHNDNDMMFSDLKILTSKFGITGYPTAYIDRSFKWNYPENMEQLIKPLAKPALCGISIESEVADAKGKVKVNVEFAGGYVEKTRLVVFVTENKLKFNQANYYTQYGANPILNFNHDNVLRYSLTHPLGDDIPETGPKGYSKDFQFDIGKYVKENLAIVAFVLEINSGENLNSRSSKLGLKTDFGKL
jgi:thiol-disulfide isomerase/thioredoxin